MKFDCDLIKISIKRWKNAKHINKSNDAKQIH